MEKRLIRFRGKSCDDGKWVYGYLIQDEVGVMSSLTTRSFIAPTLPTENTYGHLWLTYMNEVDSNTVGQYAGCVDKNKWPIYDGDILMYEGIKHNRYYVVSWDADKLMFTIGRTVLPFGKIPVYSILEDGDTMLKDYVVCGNIHENPELLKEFNEDKTEGNA